LSIVLDRLVKRYAGHAVVHRLSLEIADGELFVLLGSSGSGKSTVLRLIAGLADPDGGRVLLHGREVTALPPQHRGVGFVFQNYSLFRHMTVADNVEFPLRIRKVAAAERAHRRDELLELVGLSGLGRRLPVQLSGGQQQRVALARALAHRPEVLLLDEPFGALDARIRSELRRTLRTIQRELGVTAIFVTHDQEEAFELADRMGVLSHGRLLEAGRPDDLYLRPKTEFVATFLGTANLMQGSAHTDHFRLGPLRFPLHTQAVPGEGPPEHGESGRRVLVLFRPEDVAVKDRPEALSWPLLGRGVVEESAFSGSFERLRLKIPPIDGALPVAPLVPFGARFVRIDATRSRHQALRFPLRPGDETWVGIRRAHALGDPGLHVLVATAASRIAVPALDLAGALGRLAHARVHVLLHDAHGPAEDVRGDATRRLGAGLAAVSTGASPLSLAAALADELERQACDLVVAERDAQDPAAQLEALLGSGSHHALLATGHGSEPARALLCVALGEPGKEDVLFAGRLLRDLGAEATVLSVLAPDTGPDEQARAERYHERAARTLALLGVAAQTRLRTGQVAPEVLAELGSGGHDLLVVGAPLADRRGRLQVSPRLAELLRSPDVPAVLVVRAAREPAARDERRAAGVAF
jgi:sulfate transport system ATP-binding protein